MEQEYKKYGTVESKIRAIAETFEGYGYYFADFAQANVEFDKIERPTILYVLPPGGKMNLHNDAFLDSPETQLWFLCPADFDFDGDENDCRVEAMKRLGMRFIDAINKSGEFEYIEEFEYKVAYDTFDMNLTGVCFMPNLKEKRGVLICNDDYERPEWDERA